MAAELVWRSYLPYQISKAGLNLMVRVLARNLAPSITVNSKEGGEKSRTNWPWGAEKSDFE